MSCIFDYRFTNEVPAIRKLVLNLKGSISTGTRYWAFLIMGKLIKTHLQVIKPDLCADAMCVYKFTLDTGFYYIGATTDLADRIGCHLKFYRNRIHTKNILVALDNAKSISFEVLRFANNKKDLGIREQYFLNKNVGLKMCLNVTNVPTSYSKTESYYKVATVDRNNKIQTIFNSASEAAISAGMSVASLISKCNSKYPADKIIYRRLNENNEIIIPAKSIHGNINGKKIVRQYDNKMNFIKEFISVSEAARQIGFDRKDVSHVANGNQKSTKGFIFRYIDEKGNDIMPIYTPRTGAKKLRTIPFLKSPKKPINKFDHNGNLIETYRSTYMALKGTKIEKKKFMVLLKNSRQYNGFIFKYA